MKAESQFTAGSETSVSVKVHNFEHAKWLCLRVEDGAGNVAEVTLFRDTTASLRGALTNILEATAKALADLAVAEAQAKAAAAAAEEPEAPEAPEAPPEIVDTEFPI